MIVMEIMKQEQTGSKESRMGSDGNKESTSELQSSTVPINDSEKGDE